MLGPQIVRLASHYAIKGHGQRLWASWERHLLAPLALQSLSSERRILFHYTLSRRLLFLSYMGGDPLSGQALELSIVPATCFHFPKG